MTRTPLAQRTLPAYSRGDEIANMVTHIIGGVLGIFILLGAIEISIRHHNIWGLVSGIFYGCSMIALYTVSSVYHGLTTNTSKKVMQVIDHCTIYLLIVGSYVPVLLVAIRPVAPAAAWTVFGLELGLCAFATVFTAIDHKRYSALGMVCYILMGWLIVFFIKPMVASVGGAAFWWLLSGGIAYTVGAILYGVGKKHSIFHTIFHVFVVIGSVLQAICILFYIL